MTVDATDRSATQDASDAEVLRVEVLTGLGALMLGTGSSTNDIERVMW